MKAHFLKRFGLLAAALFLVPALLHAIVDQDHDNMSDIWEAQHGFSITSATGSQHPDADPDGDGWTNREEAEAGTDPNSGTPPAGMLRPVLVQHPDFPAVYLVSWPTLVGKEYRLSVSPDLTAGSWVQVDDPMPGTGSTIEIVLDVSDEDGGELAKCFCKVDVIDLDTDGDSLTDFEELALNLNPNLADTDRDGLADNVDPLPLVNAVDGNPDGLGLPASLETDLIGRWDFETSTVDFTGNVNLTYRYPDATSFARHASGNVNLSPEGMISKATASTATSVVAIPPAMLNTVAQNQSGLKPRYSVSFWAAVTPGSITAGPPIGLFGHSTYQPYIPDPINHPNQANWGLFRTEADGVWVQRIAGLPGQPDTFELCYGTYIYSNHNNGTLIANPVPVPNYSKVAYTQGKLDDGQWHHYLLTREGTKMSLYRDGVQVGATTSFARATIGVNSHSAISFGRLYGPSPDDNPASLSLTRCITGRLDRLRIWSRTLALADAVFLYRQDSEKDGLWDITENRTALWRDANSDTVRVSSEVAYTVNPFRADPTDVDNDHDGLSSEDEQQLGTGIDDADSDDDGIPDGYDQRYCLGALVPDTNLNSDADGDGLTLKQEVAYGTDPGRRDTDNDGTNDGPEVAQGGLPNDASDDGDPPAPGEAYSLNLAIGDQSGSESEDYNLVVNRYDPGTHQETEVYRLPSGGFGQYSGLKTVGIFRRDEEYTFRIRWMGTNNHTDTIDPKEGPDYDYTMRVEPVGAADDIVITDAFDVAAGIPESGYQLLGVHDDVQNFQGMAETVAVQISRVYIDLAVNTDMHGPIESLNDGAVADPQHNSPWKDPSTVDRDLDHQTPPRSVVIDVNNNNTDSGVSTSPTKGQVDNENNRLDTKKDKDEMTAGATGVGHSFGQLRVWAYPEEKFKNGDLSLRLSFPDTTHANIVRVFGWEDYDADGSGKPTELLGPGKTSIIFEKTGFFGAGFNNSRERKTSCRDLTIEGITYGTALLRLELIKGIPDPDSTEPAEVLATDDVRVTVNVDRFAQPPTLVATNSDARLIRGNSPHHLGIRKSNLGDPDNDAIGVRAIRGTVTLRVPGAGGRSYLTPMQGRLRRSSDNSENANSGASFWIGLTRTDTQGNLEQWVQAGIRWVQPVRESYGSVPAFYIETGDTYHNRGARQMDQVIFSGEATWLGRGANNNPPAVPLSTWDSAPIRYSFILFKVPVAKTATGEDATTEPWQFIAVDERPGQIMDNTHYVHRSISDPFASASIGDADRDEINRRYRAAIYRHLDGLFETNQTISFAPGSPDQHATISNLYQSTGIPSGQQTTPPNPSHTDGKVQLYNWAMSQFSWKTVPISASDLTVEVKTGRSLPNGAAEVGTTPHPDWNAAVNNGIFELWDNRPYGFQPR